MRRNLGFIPNSILIMQRKPKLAKALAQLTAAIWDPEGKVDRGLKHLIAHVASRTAGCQYCMAHTAGGALHFGIEDQKLEMYANLRNYWDEEQIIEITGVISTFGFINRWNDTLATPLEDEPIAVGEKFLAPHGWSPGKHRA
jgi:AhpD family alkylhydroperoxidase